VGLLHNAHLIVTVAIDDSSENCEGCMRIHHLGLFILVLHVIVGSDLGLSEYSSYVSLDGEVEPVTSCGENICAKWKTTKDTSGDGASAASNESCLSQE
jgi:hypothetical protein